jgi:streptomycin 6-kinase
VTLIPEALLQSATSLRGEAGTRWARRLPEAVARFERIWSLTVSPPFPDLFVNYVAPATRANGTPAVLKLSFPEDRGYRTEAAALEVYGGRGCARLLELDLEGGAMLLERLEPGASLSSIEDDEEATAIAASVLKRLWRPVPEDHPFPTVAELARGLERLREHFGGGSGPLPAALVEEAEELFGALIPTQREPVLLHGDLHHGNVLSARRSWLAIDPKGVVGEPAYDTASLLNPGELLKEPHPEKVLGRRIDLLSNSLDLERDRVLGWGLAKAVLTTYWSWEDSGSAWDEAILLAELLSGLRACS